ncbi:hypothetical protein ACWGDE_02010 [Streptomyces sp. NPDC054956]
MPLSDTMRVFLWVAGLTLLAVGAVVGTVVHGLAGTGPGPTRLEEADVAGAWIAEDGSGARVLIHADHSAELSREAQALVCVWQSWDDGRAGRATWVFGDGDEPRTLRMAIPGSQTVDACRFDLHADASGERMKLSAGQLVHLTLRREDQG